MKTYNIIFSPTGGTAKVAEAITKTWGAVETVDLSDKNLDSAISLEAGSLALISMPSFGGLAPQLALNRLAMLKAADVKCAIAAVYGNRAYEDTLIQMKDYAEKAGFQVIAAVGAIAEHSMLRSIAAGRPNNADCAELSCFGEKILAKASEQADKNTKSIQVPGIRPYKKAGSSMAPHAGSSCTECGLCAKSCPAGAINAANPKKTDKDACIGCMRCVAICPAKARGLNPVMAKTVSVFLKKACAGEKKNELIM